MSCRKRHEWEYSVELNAECRRCLKCGTIQYRYHDNESGREWWF